MLLFLGAVMAVSCSKDEEFLVTQSSEKEITYFAFLAASNEALSVDVTGEIDEEEKTILAEVPFGTELDNLQPTIEHTGTAIAPGTVAPNFNSEVTYTITAADGSEAIYTVTVSEQTPTDRQVLEDIFSSNPGNTIGDSWQVDDLDSDIGTWDGVTVDADGRVVGLELSNESISVVPASIGNLERLTELSLDVNNLISIPAEIGDLVQLETLYLEFNQLGTIPASIGNLQHLRELYLDFNQLGTIPAEIGNLAQLETLFLNNNSLTSIPPEIGNLAQLISLSLSNNDLTSIPQVVCDLATDHGTTIFKDAGVACE